VLQNRPIALRAALAAVLTAALALSACGRKGPLEAPTGSIEQKSEKAPDSGPVKPDKSFFLDPLI
jgi:predicted small lipoprotein YifL